MSEPTTEELIEYYSKTNEWQTMPYYTRSIIRSLLARIVACEAEIKELKERVAKQEHGAHVQ